MTRGERPSVLVWVEFAALYMGVTVAYAWPLFAVFSTALPNDTGDPGLNAWIMWWNTQALPLTDRWWNAPIFFPVPGALAFSETLLGFLPLTAPLLWAGATPIVTYNVVFLLSYPTAALSAHALAHRLMGRHDAALVAGLAFGFSPYRVAQIPHIQMLWTMWMPVCLLALHRFVDRHRARDLVMAAGSWVLTALSCGYYLVFFPVLVGIWMLWFVRSLRDWLTVGATFVASSVVLAPLLLGYQQFQSAQGLERPRSEIATFSADLSGIWSTQPSSWPASLWTMHGKSEGELYPGAIVMLLSALAIGLAWRRSERAACSRIQKGLLAASLVAGVTALGIYLGGGWQSSFLGLEISLRRPGKALFVAFVLWTAAWLLDRRMHVVWRRRSPMFFYGAAALVMLLLALGPDGHAFGHRFLSEAPYSWLMSLPGGDSVRVPARFGMLMILCLSMTAAIAFTRLAPPGVRRPIVGVLALAILIEGWVQPFFAAPIAQPVSIRRNADLGTPVLELPLTGVFSQTESMLRATAHRHPLFNGYSGYLAAHFGQLEGAINARDPSMLEALQQFGPILVVVNQAEDPGNRYARYVSQAAADGPLYRTPFGPVFRLPRRAMREQVADAERLEIAYVAGNSNQREAGNLMDGDVNSWWQTAEPQARGDEIVVVFRQPVRLVRFEMDLGIALQHYPRHLRIQLADPGTSPVIVWEGRTAGLAMLGALADHVRAPVTIDLPEPVSGRRFILGTRERQREFPWSIAELRAFGWVDDRPQGSPGATEVGSPPR
jgi:hypothetical protein